MIKNILVPVDGSEHSGKALALAADIAEKYDANLSVLFVASPEIDGDLHHFASTEYSSEYIPKYGRVVREISEQVARKIIDGMIKKVKSKVMISKVILYGDPATQIVKYVEDNNFDMIIIGSRGLGTIKGVLMGSVSRKVSKLVECTCMIIK